MVDKVKLNEKLIGLFDTLKDINSKLWVIEDDKRLCEKNSDFGEKFIKLSRDIHFLNDKRASIKLEINNQTGSKIKEIKEYTAYQLILKLMTINKYLSSIINNCYYESISK